MLKSGLKFGMILQLAIGPISMYVFNISIKYGFLVALSGAMGVVLGDGFCITLAIVGVGNALEHSKKTRDLMSALGGLVLVGFGVFMLGHLGLTQIGDRGSASLLTTFIKTLVMTVSSPMTIVFWGSVFATKLAEGQFSKKDMVLFGGGSVLSTVIAMTFMALIGATLKQFVPNWVRLVLNLIVALILIIYGIKMLLKVRLKESN